MVMLRQVLWLSTLLLVGSSQSAAAGDEACTLDSESGFAATRPCPPELKAMLERQDMCEYFRSEAAYDKERATMIQDQMQKSHCDSLAGDKIALVKSYIQSRNQDALSVLIGYEEYINGELEESPTPENPNQLASEAFYPDARLLMLAAHERQMNAGNADETFPE